ncbi:MAG: AmmeMemoRadiSam system protein B [Gammaproteobacteria bacterium]|nr:AmmeMemoRadiSam system protein B [Gammaproteobacteria bacterium]MDH5592262.1 AmmeMemoRadiSam system protein B [Gammaproteobacteria bacterium]
METIRPPAVAGLFYPARPDELNNLIEQDLKQATLNSELPDPKVLIVPHAGYIYSGPIAANAYIYLQKLRHRIQRVIIIGPSHRVGFNGVALSDADFFDTPLGRIPIDKTAQKTLSEIMGVHILNEAHAAEHSLEVQLPFLQRLLDEFTIVPIVAGNASPDLVSEVIETLWGGSETLIVISSDLSHYHDYQTAQQLDTQTSQAIINLDVNAIHSHNACGCVGIRGLLDFAQHHPLNRAIVDLRNSGDTAGSKDSVVGYGAYLFSEPT